MQIIIELRDARVISKEYSDTAVNLVHACIFAVSLMTTKNAEGVDILLKGEYLGNERIGAILDLRSKVDRLELATKILKGE